MGTALTSGTSRNWRKVTDEMYERFDSIVDEFIRRVASMHGFKADKINGERNSRGTAYYAAYRIS